jgi:acyl-[acyl-carrier-protein]-phospholipid O-acyltransferase/long-chain-fatty-acid--[acyl-carrier-protein] ligase
MILIGGPQIMKGYLNNPDKNKETLREMDGTRWYISGDKGYLDADGFLTIVDRYSRFAKLGGEMISLSQVENAVREHLAQSGSTEEIDLLAVSIPDEKKGEKIVLLSEEEIDLSAIRNAILEAGGNPLSIPSKCIQVESLPKLGSGKTDFVEAKKLALVLI